MEAPSVIHALSQHLDRKTTYRLRGVSTLFRDLVPRPKSFRNKLDTSSIAKTKMIISIGKTIGNVIITNPLLRLEDVVVRYGYQTFDYEGMMRDCPWFRHSPVSQNGFRFIKYEMYDSEMIGVEDSYTLHFWGYTWL